MTRIVIMSRASVSELKARLSHYLREVRRGGEVEVLDRGVPIARLTGIVSRAGRDPRRERLVDAGVLSPGEGDLLAAVERQGPSLSTSILEALEEERADRL
jgi:prevent-host-death family protein